MMNCQSINLIINCYDFQIIQFNVHINFVRKHLCFLLVHNSEPTVYLFDFERVLLAM